MITYTALTNPSTDHIKQIIGLYRHEGWWSEGTDDPELVKKIVAGSYCFLVALQKDEIVGMGRAISDGASDSYLQDITVKSVHRGKGIGSRIIKRLVEHLNQNGLTWIGLIAERGSHRFYEQLGFSKMPNSDPMLRIG